MEVRYWVSKNEIPYDSIGNKNKGVFRDYIVEIIFSNKDEIGFVYVGHTEMFCREIDARTEENDYILEKIPDLSNWRKVSKHVCSEPENWMLFSIDKLKAKRMFKYVEKFDEVEE